MNHAYALMGVQVAVLRRVVEVVTTKELSNLEEETKVRHSPGGGGWWIKTLESINHIKFWANKGYAYDVSFQPA